MARKKVPDLEVRNTPPEGVPEAVPERVPEDPPAAVSEGPELRDAEGVVLRVRDRDSLPFALRELGTDPLDMNILSSFAFYSHVPLSVWARRSNPWRCRVLMDSGAFTAYTKDRRISEDAYCRFLEREQDRPEFYGAMALDVIGNGEESVRVYDRMLARGLRRVLPVFHVDEPAWILDHYLERTDYIALGGMVGTGGGRGRMLQWLDWCFNTVAKRKPGTRIHGLGLTDHTLMPRYPWTSVDSSTPTYWWTRLQLKMEFYDPRSREWYVWDMNHEPVSDQSRRILADWGVDYLQAWETGYRLDHQTLCGVSWCQWILAARHMGFPVFVAEPNYNRYRMAAEWWVAKVTRR